MMHAPRRSIRRGVLVVAMAVTVTLVSAPSAFAVGDIHSSGPLTDITIGDDLTCSVTANDSNQFFDGEPGLPGSCGWTLATGGTLYGHSNSANAWASYIGG
jgi:hypothetical protein